MEVRKNGTNKAITAHILDEAAMRKIGFTDYAEDKWYYCRDIPNTDEISFNVTIPKNNPDDLAIDVLDEDFCQPYDFQAYLERNPNHEYAKRVQVFVEAQMAKLQETGVLSGHVYGEYI